MKKVVCLVKESEYENFKKELPEVFSQKDVEIKILNDKEFDAYIKNKEEE